MRAKAAPPAAAPPRLLAARLARAASARRLVLATAESCTGGMAAAALVGVVGVSNCFAGGVVAYSNAGKRALLGVGARALQADGAVSEPVARAMCLGAARALRASAALAITGVAGPGASAAGKPAGLVCFGFYVRGKKPKTETRRFAGGRRAVRAAATAHALAALAALIESGKGGGA